MPNNYSSFDYKVINPKIRDILDARSHINNTIQIAMPFIKLTSTVEIPEYLGLGNVGFTLGIHGFPSEESLLAQDIGEPRASDGSLYPLVGYTYTNGGIGSEGKAKALFAELPSSEDNSINTFFDRGTEIYSNAQLVNLLSAPHSFEAPYIKPIPPPGVTQANITRNRNGTVASAKINISVPSLLQLEFLHRTFLIPGVGMIIEWGQQFSPNSELGQSGLNPAFIREDMFPWYKRDKLDIILNRLKEKTIGLEEILKCYTYPSQGQYAWTFGRLANYSIKSNADGSFNIELMIYGVSEEGFAYATRNTIMPVPRTAIPAQASTRATTQTRGTRSGNARGNTATGTATQPITDPKICLEDANSVWSYFTTTNNGLNLKTLLDGVRSGKILPKWKRHVKFFAKGNAQTGEPITNTQSPNVSEKTFGDTDNAYFMSWRFFVNVALNNPVYGLRAIFQKAAIDVEAKKKVTILEPYVPNGYEYPFFKDDGTYVCKVCEEPGEDIEYIYDPKESFIGFNPYLRSGNPGTMLIVNETAAKKAADDTQRARKDSYGRALYADDNTSKDFRENGAGRFDLSTKKYHESLGTTPPAVEDRGFLSAGVWVNHKAVIQSMASSDTLLRGISNLLNKMNQATNNFWELTLDISEPVYVQEDICTGEITDQRFKQQMNFKVVDAKWRKDSKAIANEFANNMHIFNKFVRKKSIGGVDKLLGSDVIECSVDLSLPKLMFTQFATLGIAQPQTLNIAGSSTDKLQCPNGSVSDPADTLRQMVSITSITPRLEQRETGANGQPGLIQVIKSPDRTFANITGSVQNPNNTKPCSTIQQPAAQTGGRGYAGGASPQIPQMPAPPSGPLPEDLAKLADEVNQKINTETCLECLACTSADTSRLKPTFPTIAVASQTNLPISTDIIQQITPDQAANIEAFVRAMKDIGITKPRYVLAAVAKIYTETQFNLIPEISYATTANTDIRNIFGISETELSEAALTTLKANPLNFFNYVYSNKRKPTLGNVQPNDGYKYRGRPFIGITGKSVYQMLENNGLKQVVSNPDLLLQKDNAAKASALFLKNNLRTFTNIFDDGGNIGVANLPTQRTFTFDTMTQEDAFILLVSQIAGIASWKINDVRSRLPSGLTLLGTVLAKVRGFYAIYLAPGNQLRQEIISWLGVADEGEGTTQGATRPDTTITESTLKYRGLTDEIINIPTDTPPGTQPTSPFGSINAIRAAGHINGRLEQTYPLSRGGVVKDYWRIKGAAATTYNCTNVPIGDRVAIGALDAMMEYAITNKSVKDAINTKLNLTGENAVTSPIGFAVCTAYKDVTQQRYDAVKFGLLDKPASKNSDTRTRTSNGTNGSAFEPGSSPSGWGVAFELFAVNGVVDTRLGVPWIEGLGTTQVSDITAKSYVRISPENTPVHWAFLTGGVLDKTWGFKQADPRTPWLWVYDGPMEGTFFFAGEGQVIVGNIPTVTGAQTATPVTDADVIRAAASNADISLKCSDTQYGEIGRSLGVRDDRPQSRTAGTGGARGAGVATIPVPLQGFATNQIDAGKAECRSCAILRAQLALIEARQRAAASLEQRLGIAGGIGSGGATQAERPLRTFEGLSSVFRYYEVSPELMVANIRCSADGIRSNAFGASPGPLTISANLTLPGIAGLRIGELFWIDRIPAFYKAFGAFQIINLEDEITLEGWQTKIEARFNYLGREWQQRILDAMKAAQSIQAIAPTVTQPGQATTPTDGTPITNPNTGGTTSP